MHRKLVERNKVCVYLMLGLLIAGKHVLCQHVNLRHSLGQESTIAQAARHQNIPHEPADHSSSSSSNSGQPANQFEATLGHTYEPLGGLIGLSQPATPCKLAHISQIKCWRDTDGYIAALAFESEDGISTPAVCTAYMYAARVDGGSLLEGESIVEVISCRGASSGVLYMEFHTDKAHKYPITCGAGGALLPGSIAAGGAAVECESLSQGKLTRGPTARVATAALSVTRRKQQTAAPDAPAYAYPVAGLRATCNA